MPCPDVRSPVPLTGAATATEVKDVATTAAAIADLNTIIVLLSD